MSRTIARFVSIVGLVSVIPLGRASAAEPAVEEQRALGASYASAHRWEEARRALDAAWNRDRSPETAAALGHVELQLGLPVLAAEHLSFALANAADGADWPSAFFDLVEARRLVTTVRVSVRPGATVFVDEARIGDAPLERPVFVEAGRHTVRVEQAGFQTKERSFEGRMGAEVQTDFGLVPVDAAPPPAPSPAAEAPPPWAGKNPWLIGVGAVAGTTTLAIGMGYGIKSITTNDKQEQHNVNAGVLGTIGAATLAATITYVLWPSSGGSRASVVASPLVFEKGTGVSLRSSF